MWFVMPLGQVDTPPSCLSPLWAIGVLSFVLLVSVSMWTQEERILQFMESSWGQRRAAERLRDNPLYRRLTFRLGPALLVLLTVAVLAKSAAGCI